jgi:surface antigen
MRIRQMLFAASAAVALSTTLALAQEGPPPPGGDPDGYYSRTDHDGYYDRDGHYRHMDANDDRGDADDDRGPPDDRRPPPDRESYYDRDCHAGTAAGTVAGAAGGGLIGGAASHGNPAAIVGGIFLGGLLGNALSRDVDCDDQRYAYDTYHDGLYGEIGRHYEWNHGESHGYFVATREFNDGGDRCRAFTTVTYRHGEEMRHEGIACYDGGKWRTHDG